jgi:hypothetical protein
MLSLVDAVYTFLVTYPLGDCTGLMEEIVGRLVRPSCLLFDTPELLLLNDALLPLPLLDEILVSGGPWSVFLPNILTVVCVCELSIDYME